LPSRRTGESFATFSRDITGFTPRSRTTESGTAPSPRRLRRPPDPGRASPGKTLDLFRPEARTMTIALTATYFVHMLAFYFFFY